MKLQAGIRAKKVFRGDSLFLDFRPRRCCVRHFGDEFSSAIKKTLGKHQLLKQQELDQLSEPMMVAPRAIIPQGLLSAGAEPCEIATLPKYKREKERERERQACIDKIKRPAGRGVLGETAQMILQCCCAKCYTVLCASANRQIIYAGRAKLMMASRWSFG